jgi:hypothetical protein
MRVVRSHDAERAFEEALGSRDEVTALVSVARKAATGGRETEVLLCLEKLRTLAPAHADALSEELYELLDAVRSHPSFGSRRAG